MAENDEYYTLHFNERDLYTPDEQAYLTTYVEALLDKVPAIAENFRTSAENTGHAVDITLGKMFESGAYQNFGSMAINTTDGNRYMYSTDKNCISQWPLSLIFAHESKHVAHSAIVDGYEADVEEANILFQQIPFSNPDAKNEAFAELSDARTRLEYQREYIEAIEFQDQVAELYLPDANVVLRENFMNSYALYEGEFVPPLESSNSPLNIDAPSYPPTGELCSPDEQPDFYALPLTADSPVNIEVPPLQQPAPLVVPLPAQTSPSPGL